MRKAIWLGLGAALVVSGAVGLSDQAQAATSAPVARVVTPASANGCDSMKVIPAVHLAVPVKPQHRLAVPGAAHI
jgi:hypothetical protein